MTLQQALCAGYKMEAISPPPDTIGWTIRLKKPPRLSIITTAAGPQLKCFEPREILVTIENREEAHAVLADLRQALGEFRRERETRPELQPLFDCVEAQALQAIEGLEKKL